MSAAGGGPPWLAATAARTQLALSASSSTDVLMTADAGNDEFTLLVSTLREMLAMTAVDCKRAWKRLYLTWHPDKCSKPFARRFFDIIRKFSQLYEAGEREQLQTFVASLRPDAQDVTYGYQETHQHTWVDEVLEEEAQRGQMSAQPEVVAAGRSGSSGSSSVHGAGSNSSSAFGGGGRNGRVEHNLQHAASQPRMKNAALGDASWQMAQSELQAARVMQANQLWCQAVFHSQQCCEHVVKAAMLRTCGVTGEEFRGADGHDLLSLMTQTQLTPPVAREQLQQLSRAYLDTRYSPFPPRGLTIVPLTQYTSQHAEEGLEIATALVEWGRSTESIETSLGAAAVPTNGQPAGLSGLVNHNDAEMHVD